jgi:predicted Na+-dependent transporter
MLDILNRKLQKAMPFITPTCLILGILLADTLSPYAFLVPWLFGFMTFSGSLGSGFRDLVRTVSQPWYLLASLLILHVAIPLIAFAIGSVLFHGDDYVITGLLLGVVIPTGVTSFIWVSVYRGNAPLTLSIILIDTLLSPYIVPHSLALLVGAKVSMDTWAMTKGLFWMVVVPSLAGMALNQLSKGRVKETLAPKLAPFSKICIGFVVAINGGVVAPYLKPFTWRLAAIALTVLLIAVMGYSLGWLLSRLMRWDRGITICMTFNSGMRNISAGAVLAVAYFPAPVAIPVILGILFQQVLASLFGLLLGRFETEKKPPVGAHTRAI